jgi:hypothetical protein
MPISKINMLDIETQLAWVAIFCTKKHRAVTKTKKHL